MDIYKKIFEENNLNFLERIESSKYYKSEKVDDLYNYLCNRTNISKKKIYLFTNMTEKYYKKFEIPKKNGKLRKIISPTDELKKIQKCILEDILYKEFSIDNVATGFVPERSILDNAKNHIHQKCVINLDLKDFFPNISSKKVYIMFRQIGYSIKKSLLLTKLCTYENKLPQGAPTSPFISNVICRNLDKRLKGLCLKNGFIYSRYADDLTFSGNKNIIFHLNKIKKIIENEGFYINTSKERITYQNHQQSVTGLVVNGTKVSIPKKTLNYLRGQIYYCNKYGVFDNLKRQGKEFVSNYKEHLYGLAYFVKMIDKEKGIKFLNELNEIKWET